MNAKQAGNLLMVFGGVLLLSAFLLLLLNRSDAARAAQTAKSVLPEIQQQIPTDTTPVLVSAPQALPAMTEIEIDGYDYIGYLSIPALELELPVLSAWDAPRLRIAPCRQFGSVEQNDLVIAGHNYRRHFGRLSQLRQNDLLQFSDMDGAVTLYRVGRVTVISPASVEMVKNSEWDIVLYTCTYGGQRRVMVGASRLSPDELAARSSQGP